GVAHRAADGVVLLRASTERGLLRPPRPGDGKPLLRRADPLDVFPIRMADVRRRCGAERLRAGPLRGVAGGGGTGRRLHCARQRFLVSGGLVSTACRGRLGLPAVADEFPVADHAGAALRDLVAVAAGLFYGARRDCAWAADAVARMAG